MEPYKPCKFLYYTCVRKGIHPRFLFNNAVGRLTEQTQKAAATRRIDLELGVSAREGGDRE